MHRRSFLSGSLAASAVAQPRTAPNILYVHSHDTGRYVEPYGHAVPAPNLQKFASEGVLFRQAFNANPTCSPSRACLLTGQYAHSNGMLGLAHRGFSLKDYKQHVLHTLRPAGYESTLIGVQHIARDPKLIGYDRIIPAKSTKVEHVVPAGVEFLRSKPKHPFFLDIGFFETHREFHEPGPSEDPRYTLPPAPIPDTRQTRRDMAAYKASARVLDAGIGTLLRELESSGLASNTLVICTTDHGIPFPEMKCSLRDGGIGVMLMMRGPGGFSGGRVVDAMVSHIDLFPTMCEVAGVAKPSWLQGRSLLPVVRGEAAKVRDEVFAEVNYHAAYEPKRAVRTERHKYIRHFDKRGKPVLPNCDDGYSKSVWLDAGWSTEPVPEEELYDLVFDPNETRNLAADPKHRDVHKDMAGRLDRWMRETDDPLLKGPVRLPPGAKVNDADGVSPKEPVKG